MKQTSALIRCPACRRGFLSIGEGVSARCAECRKEFPVADGMIDLLPAVKQTPHFAQRAMEWPPLVRIYESRLWRRSPFLAVPFGFSFEKEQEYVLRALDLQPDARVLDLACGPGIYTRPIARAVTRGVTIGLDLSLPMLSYATARAHDEGVGNIIWLRASAMEIPLADAALDCVNCCGALHLFPDVPRVLAEVARVLKPGGRFTCGTTRRLDGMSGSVETRMTAWSGVTYRSSEELKSLLEGAGFGNVEVFHAKRIWQIASAVRKKSRT